MRYVYKKYPKSDLYVLRGGRFVKLPPKKKKVAKINWRALVFVGFLLAGFLIGNLLDTYLS